MSGANKDIVWFSGEIKTPPFSTEARLEAGFLLRRVQQGEHLSMPDSRPMPSIGKRCHELRVKDENEIWRIIYRIDSEAIVILEVFRKKSKQTPKYVIDNCKARITIYDQFS